MVEKIWGGDRGEQLRLTSRELPAAEVGMLIGLSAVDGFLAEYPGAQFQMYSATGYPELEWGFQAFLVRHPAATRSSARLLVYNHGHVGWYFSAPDARALLRQAYNDGYDLLLTAMPMVAWNAPTHPVRAKTWDGWGAFLPTAQSHAFFAMLDTGRSHYLKFFLDPVIVPLNQTLADYSYETVDMVGISGGGWTALLVGAIEPRIRKVVSVAGFLPMRHRDQSRDFGDIEQVAASFYRIFSYDLLVAAASRPGQNGRELWLMYNSDDPSCFGGAQAARYASELRQQGNQDVRIVVRQSQKHDLDPVMIREILSGQAK